MQDQRGHQCKTNEVTIARPARSPLANLRKTAELRRSTANQDPQEHYDSSDADRTHDLLIYPPTTHTHTHKRANYCTTKRRRVALPDKVRKVLCRSLLSSLSLTLTIIMHNHATCNPPARWSDLQHVVPPTKTHPAEGILVRNAFLCSFHASCDMKHLTP